VAGSEEHAFRGAAAVFSGAVTAIESVHQTEHADAYSVVRFKILDNWKGFEGDRIALHQRSSETCDYGFEVGKEYLVYARLTIDGFLSGHLCGGTKPLPLAEAADELKRVLVRSLQEQGLSQEVIQAELEAMDEATARHGD
jgi:hypothetical protein